MKLGDKVKVIKTIFADKTLGVGCTGVIIEVRDAIFEVEMDDAPYPEEGEENMWPFFADELEVIQ